MKLAASTRATEHPVTITVYPGAHHSFDSDRPVRFVAARVNSNAPGGRGATTGGDAAAWADSIRRVTEFFGRAPQAVTEETRWPPPGPRAGHGSPP